MLTLYNPEGSSAPRHIPYRNSYTCAAGNIIKMFTAVAPFEIVINWKQLK